MLSLRNKLVDMLKGYVCFLVVFGHVIMGIRKANIQVPFFSIGLENFIWSFHVELFMFLSGYVYNATGGWQRKKTRTNFLLNKLLNLGVPYLTFSIVYIVINSVLGKGSVNTEYSLQSILRLWKTPIAQYWFLYNLLLLFIEFVVLDKWLKNWQITFVIFVIQVICSYCKISIPQPFNYFINMALYFGVGASVSSLKIAELNRLKQGLVILVHIGIAWVVLRFSLEQNIIISSLLSILGIVVSICLISILNKSTKMEKVLLGICKYSFPIYLIHTIFTAGMRIVMIKVGIENYYIHMFVGLIFGIVIPVLIAKVSDKISVAKFFFYPSKALARMRKKGN